MRSTGGDFHWGVDDSGGVVQILYPLGKIAMLLHLLTGFDHRNGQQCVCIALHYTSVCCGKLNVHDEDESKVWSLVFLKEIHT